MTPLKVAYVGNFAASWYTENHVADALELNGHAVVRLDEVARATWQQLAAPPADWSAVLWTGSRLGAPAAGLVAAGLAGARAAALPVVGCHLDRWWGLARQAVIATSLFHHGVDVLCTADGGHQAEWAAVGIEHWWMPPAIATAEAARAPAPAPDVPPVVFVGSWDRYSVAADWPHRAALIDHLRARWGPLLGLYPRDRQRPCRGQALTDVVNAATVVVGDSCLAGGATHYWSDRIPETLGRGGYLLHPAVEGLDAHYTPGVHLDTFQVGDFAALDDLIAAALADPERGRAVGVAARAHVVARHLYQHRVADVLERLWQARTLRTYQRHSGPTPVVHRKSGVRAVFDVRPGTTDGEVIDELWRDDQYRLTADQVAGGAVIDVGANVGAFAVWAANAGARVVHAYEPEPSLADQLALNVGLNPAAGGVVVVRRVAVWSEAGDQLRVARAVPGYEGGTRTRPRCELADGFDVPAVKLADAVGAVLAFGPAGGRVALLKIDCEGCEYPLLAGATANDLDRIDRIVMEFHGRKMPHMFDMVDGWRFGTVVEQLAEVGIPVIFGRPSTGGIIYWRHHRLDAPLAAGHAR